MAYGMVTTPSQKTITSGYPLHYIYKQSFILKYQLDLVVVHAPLDAAISIIL